MIALTLDEIAELVGGRARADASAADVVVSAPASVDSRHVAPRWPVRRRCWASTSTATTTSARRWPPARRAAWSPGRSRARTSWFGTSSRRWVCSPRAVVERLVIDGPLQVVALTGSSGKTTHEGPADAGAAANRARPSPRRETSTTSSGVPLTAARRRRVDAAARARDGRADGGRHRLPGRGRAATDRVGAQRRCRALRGVRWQGGDRPGRRASSCRRCRRTRTVVSPSSTPTTSWWPPWRPSPRHGSSRSAPATGADVRAGDVTLDEEGRPSFAPARRRVRGRPTVPGVGHRQAPPARRAPGVQRAGRRCRRPRARALAGRASPPR